MKVQKQTDRQTNKPAALNIEINKTRSSSACMKAPSEEIYGKSTQEKQC